MSIVDACDMIRTRDPIDGQADLVLALHDSNLTAGYSSPAIDSCSPSRASR